MILRNISDSSVSNDIKSFLLSPGCTFQQLWSLLDSLPTWICGSTLWILARTSETCKYQTWIKLNFNKHELALWLSLFCYHSIFSAIKLLDNIIIILAIFLSFSFFQHTIIWLLISFSQHPVTQNFSVIWSNWMFFHFELHFLLFLNDIFFVLFK